MRLRVVTSTLLLAAIMLWFASSAAAQGIESGNFTGGTTSIGTLNLNANALNSSASGGTLMLRTGAIGSNSYASYTGLTISGGEMTMAARVVVNNALNSTVASGSLTMSGAGTLTLASATTLPPMGPFPPSANTGAPVIRSLFDQFNSLKSLYNTPTGPFPPGTTSGGETTITMGNTNINTIVNSGAILNFGTGSLLHIGALNTGDTVTLGLTPTLTVGPNSSLVIAGPVSTTGGGSIKSITVNGNLTLSSPDFLNSNRTVTLNGGTLTITSGAQSPAQAEPTLASNYDLSDLGNLSDWLTSESVSLKLANYGSSATVSPLKDFHVFLPNMQDVGGLASLLDTSGAGWTLTSKLGIDDSGDIVASATESDASVHAVLLAPPINLSIVPVPEPTTAALACIALGALLVVGRMRR